VTTDVQRSVYDLIYEAEMIEKVLVGASMALIAVGLAAPASANPVQKHHPVQDFLAAVQAAGLIGVEPATLASGYNVCWELWQGGYTGDRAAAAIQKNYPTTTDQAAHFVIAAYKNLCPVPGAYDWWAYSAG
jgi:Protein of unknown function (DUF732)